MPALSEDALNHRKLSIIIPLLLRLRQSRSNEQLYLNLVLKVTLTMMVAILVDVLKEEGMLVH